MKKTRRPTAHSAEATGATYEALAEFLSVLWYQALFGAEPRRVQHPASQALLALSQLDPLEG